MATQTGSLDLSAVKQAFIKTVAKAQPIYKRTNANSAPNPPTSKITATTDQGTSGNWTTMHMARLCSTNFAYKYLWTCNQLLAQDGTFLGTTEVVADNGTTVINGDEIATGTIAAERLNIADTITAINNNSTTTINGGKITTGTIGANQIAAQSIGASHLTISDNANLATANETYEASLPTEISASYLPAISDGYLVKKTASQQYLMVTDYVANSFKTGDELYYEFYGKVATAGSINIGAFGYTGTPPTHTYSHQQIQSITLTTTKEFYSGTLTLSNANWNNATQYLLGFQDARSTKSQIYISKLVIRRKSPDAATATSYITYIDAETGIQVHDSEDSDNYIQMNADEICIYKDNIPTLSLTSEDITVGDDSSTHIVITSDSLGFWQNDSTEIMSIDTLETSFRMGGYTWIATDDRLTLWG